MKKVYHKVVVVVAVDKIFVLSLFSAANHDHTHYLLPFVVSSCWSLLLLLLLSYVFTVFLSFCSLNRFVVYIWFDCCHQCWWWWYSFELVSTTETIWRVIVRRHSSKATTTLELEHWQVVLRMTRSNFYFRPWRHSQTLSQLSQFFSLKYHATYSAILNSDRLTLNL